VRKTLVAVHLGQVGCEFRKLDLADERPRRALDVAWWSFVHHGMLRVALRSVLYHSKRDHSAEPYIAANHFQVVPKNISANRVRYY
jgi:hypothetical protein